MWLGEGQMEDEMKGKIYQGYEILQVAGSGTFGKVYKVKNIQNGNIYAMKHVLQNKKYKNRQLDIMKQINSNYAVKLIEHFYKEQTKGQYLNLIMQYLPEPLSRVLRSYYPQKIYMSTPTIIQYTKCLLTGLKDLHALDICHRDIKPSNILLDQANAKFCDFGSAKILSSGQKNISYICSRYYRAPQLLLGAVYYTFQVDIWSLGCVIAEMMTNHGLFEGSTATSMLSKIIKCLGSPTIQDLKSMNIEDDQMSLMEMQGSGVKHRILKYNPNCSQQLLDLVARMVVYDPKKRIRASEALNLPLFT